VTARPALADVLAALTECDDAAWWRYRELMAESRLTDDGVEWRRGPSVSWLHGSPAEAVEALQHRELAPADDERRRWWCPCAGKGDGARHGGLVLRCPHGRGQQGCDGKHWTHPTDLPSLVAVASLGCGRWLRAEALARVVEPGAVVVWRVMTAADVTALVHRASVLWREAPKPVSAWGSLMRAPGEADGIAEYYRAHGLDVRPIRELLSLGVHLVAHEVGRVTLAVESLA